MKLLLAVTITAAVCAAGAYAHDAAVTPARVAKLEARVAALEAFNRNCLQRVNLTENADGYMVWGLGPPTPHAARFYAFPATSSPRPGC